MAKFPLERYGTQPCSVYTENSTSVYSPLQCLKYNFPWCQFNFSMFSSGIFHLTPILPKQAGNYVSLYQVNRAHPIGIQILVQRFKICFVFIANIPHNSFSSPSLLNICSLEDHLVIQQKFCISAESSLHINYSHLHIQIYPSSFPHL